jgi:hypothetical protein
VCNHRGTERTLRGPRPAGCHHWVAPARPEVALAFVAVDLVCRAGVGAGSCPAIWASPCSFVVVGNKWAGPGPASTVAKKTSYS